MTALKKTSQALVLFAAIGAIVGCTHHDQAQNNMNDFRKTPTANFHKALRTPAGEAAEIMINSNDTELAIHLEVQRAGTCWVGTGRISVASMNDYDLNGQYYQLSNLQVQSWPQKNVSNGADKFVHFVAGSTTAHPCPPRATKAIAEDLFNFAFSHHQFAELNLSAQQLNLKNPLLKRGSSVVMLYSQADKLGLIFDANTNSLVGVSVAKIDLETPYVFTVNRANFDISKNVYENLMPLIFNDRDLTIYNRSHIMRTQYQSALQQTEKLDEENKQIRLAAAWHYLITDNDGEIK